ncbi:MAG: hypothetical protein QM582_18870 [Micropruina sp.]|uniref:hypothetical protein n=1 Tax=Micropruina sp. TaxID=2737536 RepID=UPI0039E6FE67
MPILRRPLALLLAVPALVAGCSAAPATPPASTPPAISANPTPVSTDPAPGPTITDGQAEGCPFGDYKATGFTVTGVNGATGKGTVTDVEVTFHNGLYTFEFDEDHPITLTIDKRTEQVRIDGDFEGAYTGQPDALMFTRGNATGTAKVKRNGKTQSYPMREVAAILAPRGKGSAVCAAGTATIRTGTLTWEFVRDLD